jgi:transcriptional regulator with XRE-family HTH domain
MKLRELRLKSGKTQFEVGRAVNVQPQKISEVENGRRDLRFQEAIQIATFLDVSLDELAGIQKQKPATDRTERVGMNA